MKGVIFNLLQADVEARCGGDGWDALLDAAGLDRGYTALGSYPDAEFAALVRARAAQEGLTPGDVIRRFGRAALPLLAVRYPHFFVQAGSTRRFLKNLNDIVHPQVHQFFAGATCPHFDYEVEEEERFVLLYSSPRRLCPLALGLIEGLAAHFDETISVSHPECMLQGAPACRIVIE